MGAIGFRCECGDIKFEQCLKACPKGERCMSRPTLVELSKVRAWKGKGSTTQLLNGTRYSMLEIKTDYYIVPDEQAFRLLGTHHHDLLEKNAGIQELAEEWIDDAHQDLYDGVEETIFDYKTTGSYKIAKSLGIDFKMVDHPEGEVYKTNGKDWNKGDIKKVKEYFINPDKADNFEWNMQLNRYRIDYEKAGFTVKKLKVQVTVRDGGTHIAKGRGIDKNIYMIDIPILNDDEVMKYFTEKEAALQEALKTGVCAKCSDRESWDGIRCDRYCPVSKECQEMEPVEVVETKEDDNLTWG